MSGRTVIFGGTFDPIHVAHLALAEGAADELEAERVLFIPAGTPPHKREAALSPAEDRFRMVELAIAGNDRFAASRMEIDRGGRSWAIDTIRQVARGGGAGSRPLYLIGADSLADLPAWREPEAILDEAEVVVAPRPGFDPAAGGGRPEKVRFLRTPRIDLSATTIREKVRRGESIRYLVPEAVREYIDRRGLYAGKEERDDGAAG